jgi:hypothetical protein
MINPEKTAAAACLRQPLLTSTAANASSKESSCRVPRLFRRDWSKDDCDILD